MSALLLLTVAGCPGGKPNDGGGSPPAAAASTDSASLTAGGEQGFVLEISFTSTGELTVDTEKCHLSEKNKPFQDHCRWHNATNGTRILKFTTATWPFMEKQQSITIAPGEYSEYYTLSPAAQSGTSSKEYKYQADLAWGSSSNPTEPSVSADP